MPELIGLDFKLFRNTGTYAAPTWNEITKVKDVNPRLSRKSAEIANRSSAWTLHKPTLKEFSLEFEMSYDAANDDLTAIRDAFLNGTALDLWAADGPAAAGSQGPRAIMVITQFERSEPLDGEAVVSVVAMPTPNSHSDPVWFTHA